MQSETMGKKAPINESQLNTTTDLHISYLKIPPPGSRGYIMGLKRITNTLILVRFVVS